LPDSPALNCECFGGLPLPTFPVFSLFAAISYN
jgi:hypothetical protein